MAKDASFDIVSSVDMQEIDNAVNQAKKEIDTRFDFKNTKCDIDFDGTSITLTADDDHKLDSVMDVLQTKLVKRGVSLKALQPGKVESASQGAVRQAVTLAQGIDQDTAKQITKKIKDAKLKVQATIQGDQVRVSGKSRDDLQAVIQLLRESDIAAPLQFINYR